MTTRMVLLSLPEFERLRELVALGGIGDRHEGFASAVTLDVLLRERLLRVVGGLDILTSDGREFVRSAVISGRTVSAELSPG